MTDKVPEALAVLDQMISNQHCWNHMQKGRDFANAESAKAGKARAAFAALYEASARANGEHSAPSDCYATGPLTGDPYRDLVSCPGCQLVAAIAAVEKLP
jgi:hypothetical protein